MTSLLLGPADEVRRRGLRRMRAIAPVPAAARRRRVPAHAAPRRRLGLRQRGRGGGDGRGARRLVRGHRAVPAPAGPAGPAHGDHPHPQGRARPEPAGVRERPTSCTADVARDRVASADVARRAGRWLEDEGHAPGSWPRWRPPPRRRCAPAPGRGALARRGVHAAAARRGAAERGRGPAARRGRPRRRAPRAGRPRRRRGPRVAVGQPAHRRPGDGRPGTVVVTAVAGRQGDRPASTTRRSPGWPTSATTPATRPALPWTTC